jgi:hypothetical protein
VNEVSGIEGNVDFFVELYRAENVLTVDLEFVVDGSMLYGVEVQGLNGFEQPYGPTKWTALGGDMWKGEVTLFFPAGALSTGLTAQKASIAKLVFSPKDMGEATLTLTGFKASGLEELGGITVPFTTKIEVPSATTSIEQTVWSKYDLNRDNKVDALDLSCVLLYIGFNGGQSEWSTLVKVVDSKGKPIYPYMCDFVADNVINMLDVMDLYIHYTK